MGGAFVDSNAETVAPQGVGSLDADVSCANDGSGRGPLLAEEPAHSFRIVERVKGEHVRLREAGDSQRVAPRARRDDQMVVADALAGFQLDLAARVCDADHTRAGAHVDIALLTEIFG